MKIGEKKWAVNFRPESKKLQVSESVHTEKWNIFKKSSETPGSIHNFVPHKKLDKFDFGGGRGSKIVTLLFDSKSNASGPRAIRGLYAALERFCENRDFF